MASLRFENNEYQADKPGGKVFFFDSSPQLLLSNRYGSLENFDLREVPSKKDNKTWDVYATPKAGGRAAKIGQLFYNPPQWPGGPCYRRPTSRGQQVSTGNLTI